MLSIVNPKTMGLFDIFGKSKPERTFLLQDNLGDFVESGKYSTSTAKSVPVLTRINPANLERLYHSDEIVFNGVNVTSSVFLSAPYTISADEKGSARITDWMDHVDFKYLLQRIVQDMFIYGNAWVEMIRNEDGALVNLQILDPKYFDVSRNRNGVPLYDEKGAPKYYVQYLTNNEELPKDAKIINQSDLWGNSNKAIEIPTDNLCHFVLHTVGNDPLGIGVVEPMYNVTMAKLMIRQGITQSTQRIGWPLIGFAVGDEQHHPTPEQLKALYDKTENINERTTFVHAYFIKPYILESKQSTQMQEHLTRYEAAQVAALGIPASLVTGAGEDTNRSTLERQIYIWEKRIVFVQHRLASVINNQILAQLARQWKLKTSNPKMVFDDVSTESLFGRVERWSVLAKSGLINPEDNIRKHIRDMEHLPVESKSNKVSQANPGVPDG